MVVPLVTHDRTFAESVYSFKKLSVRITKPNNIYTLIKKVRIQIFWTYWLSGQGLNFITTGDQLELLEFTYFVTKRCILSVYFQSKIILSFIFICILLYNIWTKRIKFYFEQPNRTWISNEIYFSVILNWMYVKWFICSRLDSPTSGVT